MDSKLNLLIAFPYFTKQMVGKFITLFPNQNDYRLIVDSGAFSAYNAGMNIELDDYCKFLDNLFKSPIKVEAYIQLDVVFDGEATQKNYNIMIEKGYDPCPIFTRGDSEDYFFELINSGKYVFVGGVQRGVNNRNFAKWVLENSTNKKVHLLAFIKPDFINHYKPYSVDASSWSSTSRYGTIAYYYKGRVKMLDKIAFNKAPSKLFIQSCKNLCIPDHAIKKLRFNDSWQSFSAKDFSIVEDIPVKGLAQFISLVHWIYYSIMAQNKVGTKIYLAVGQPLHLEIMHGAYKHLRDNKLI
jgi:hypothetical protein